MRLRPRGAGKIEEQMTAQRRAVLEVVRASEGHLTAGEVYAAARAVHPTISYATVYNSLHYLTRMGLIAEITFGAGANRFDRIVDRHDHALCEGCGRLVDLELPETADLMRRAARQSRFKPVSISLTLIGLCPECQAEG
ncbi:MAG: transcriptional repressor [Acidobacteria bacterium]|nr:transcriptional repressor [Acidobacteriota bacterium]MCW5970812.1 transcriptional repressor [Blastocatellales bacterium]